MLTLVRVLICVVYMLGICYTVTAQSSSKFQKQAIILKRMIERNHYSPKPVNDLFSQQLFEHFIHRLDENNLYFTSADIKELSAYRSLLDDELNGKEWNFFNKVLIVYRQRLQKADSLIAAIMEKPFDLQVNERIFFTKDSMRHAQNEQEYKRRWNKWLKYNTLIQLTGDIIEGDDPKKALQNEASARQKVKASERRSIQKILNHPSGYDQYIAALYCDEIANAFDPHTEYMPPAEKETFEAQVGAAGFYFGITLSENAKGEVEIDRLMPGSPAWKSGELNKGDVLLKLSWEGKEPIDLKGATEEEISELLSGSNTNRLHITVRKANGIEKTTSLIKEKIKDDDNTVKGFVLKGSKKIGYIYLPDFYTALEGGTASCANDVAKEIVKLKKENIEGLILDVRFNGGGSLTEALDMAGIFIDAGPLCMLKEKTGKIISLKDMNRGTIYDGPLVLLVNGQSASASELLGAVLQDYNRAIVVGSSTYGKGTAQIILPMDTSIAVGAIPENITPEYGFVKVTINKFYRVNGSTTQHKGVQPDIVLPDAFDGLNYHESSAPFALAADSVQKNAYYKPLTGLPHNDLRNKSKLRVTGNASFNAMKEYSILLRNVQTQATTSISLKWSDYIVQTGEYKKFKDTVVGTSVATGRFTAHNNAFDQNKINADVFLQEINNNWLQKLVRDIYVEEAFSILLDHIQLLETKTN